MDGQTDRLIDIYMDNRSFWIVALPDLYNIVWHLEFFDSKKKEQLSTEAIILQTGGQVFDGAIDNKLAGKVDLT